jgi:hypothetical protein
MHTRSTLALWLLMAGALGGCDEAPHKPDFAIGAEAKWNDSPASPADVGYDVAVVLIQRKHGDSCRTAAASTTLLVDGQSIPLTRDPASDCLEGKTLVGPLLTEKAVAVRVEEEGQLVGQVSFEGLMPGVAAKLVSPADGHVRAGDDIHIVPPPSLPTSNPELATLFLPEAPVWSPNGFAPGTPAERRHDGIHLTAPRFVGSAILVFDGMPFVPEVALECPGLFACTANASNTLGPIFLTGVP